MTQMGLDYQKHVENMRHNLATETVDSRNATSNERNAASNEKNALSNRRNAATNEKQASTSAYIASFKPREVAAQELTAQSNLIKGQAAADQATVAKLSLPLKEREVTAREQSVINEAERNAIQKVFNDEKIRNELIRLYDDPALMATVGPLLGKGNIEMASNILTERLYDFVERLL